MKLAKPVTLLAIETSCDETAASVLRGNIHSKEPQFEVLSSVVKSQIKLHSKMGGVVPEVAARAHVAAIRPVVEKALSDANIRIKHPNDTNKKADESAHYKNTNIDYIAVTSGPGLIASLLVGVEFAKSLSMATGIPMLSINHMQGHLYSPFGAGMPNSQFPMSNLPTVALAKEGDGPKTKDKGPKINFPILSMIVSGGHTLLVLQKNESHYQVLGSTVDDAAGEAFDKVAKLLELPYPGGPQISKLAMQGEATINFPRPMIDAPNFNFSFSGLKTAVLYHLKETYGSTEKKTNLHRTSFGHISEKDKANIARSFEEAVVDVLVTKALRAVKKYNCKTISLSGGVAANARLRAQLKVESEKLKVEFIVPDFRLCTDNAEMIALAAYFRLRAGYKPVAFTKVKANSNWEL